MDGRGSGQRCGAGWLVGWLLAGERACSLDWLQQQALEEKKWAAVCRTTSQPAPHSPPTSLQARQPKPARQPACTHGPPCDRLLLLPKPPTAPPLQRQ
ncbi:hypothetical protein BC831DRAFT_443962 [Entophlyctis helioformis]|nr:hypothetical protein BC831DRAFT_443962 [Entophlyctis helioformis]